MDKFFSKAKIVNKNKQDAHISQEMYITCNDNITSSKDQKELKLLYSRVLEAYCEALYKNSIELGSLPQSFFSYKATSELSYLFSVGSLFFLRVQWKRMKERESNYRLLKFFGLGFLSFSFVGLIIRMNDYYKDLFISETLLNTDKVEDVNEYKQFSAQLLNNYFMMPKKV